MIYVKYQAFTSTDSVSVGPNNPSALKVQKSPKDNFEFRQMGWGSKTATSSYILPYYKDENSFGNLTTAFIFTQQP